VIQRDHRADDHTGEAQPVTNGMWACQVTPIQTVGVFRQIDHGLQGERKPSFTLRISLLSSNSGKGRRRQRQQMVRGPTGVADGVDIPPVQLELAAAPY